MGKETDKVMIDVNKFGAAVVSVVIIAVHQPVVFGNPVLSGFSRSGWVASKGRAIVDEDLAPIDEEVARSLAGSRLAETQRKVVAIARAYTLKQGSMFISNNVPYIVPLNEGSSAQAPKQFVEKAIATGVSSITPAIIRRFAG